jgi:hypothetical protein
LPLGLDTPSRPFETEGVILRCEGPRPAFDRMRRTPMQGRERYAPLRPEARPVEYSKLDKSQQKAFDRLVGMLAATMEELRTLEASKRTTAAQALQATPAWLDYRLKSRLAFLYGDRGTGKSTVLLSSSMPAWVQSHPIARLRDSRNCGARESSFSIPST